VNVARTKKLGDVAEFIRGITFKPDDIISAEDDGAVVCMRTKNVQETLDCSDILAVPQEFVRRTNQYLKAGDTLVSSANSWNLVGKCCWVPALPWSATFGGFISVLRGYENQVEPRYLYHWFSSRRVQTLLRSFGQKTTNISNLNIDRCLQLELPLPCFTEQRRIAAILDKASELCAKRKESLALLDSMAQSIFIDMFGDPNRNPHGWPVCPIGELTDCIVPGRDKPKSFSGSIPWVTTEDLQHLGETTFSSKNIGLTMGEIENVRARIIPADSVIISCVGKLGVVSISGNEMVINQQLHSFQCRQRVSSIYLMNYLPSQVGYMYAKASSTTLPYMNKTVCNSIPVMVPPIELQKEFAERVSSITSARSEQLEAVQLTEELFASLQHNAFIGVL
jgi:type I restriction enzyme, S subunit